MRPANGWKSSPLVARVSDAVSRDEYVRRLAMAVDAYFPCDRVDRDPENTTHVRCLLPTGHKLTAGDAVVEAKLGKRSVAKSPDGLFTLEEMKVTKVVPAKSDLFTPRAGVAIVIKGTQLAVAGMPNPTVTIDGTPCGSLTVHSTFDGPKGTGAREHRDVHCVVPTEKGLGGKETFTVVNG